MKIKIAIISAAVVALTVVGCKKETTAEDNKSIHDTIQHKGHDHTAGGETSDLMASLDKMMEKMHSLKMTGNADYDLAALMEEHHKSAVDMAEILLDKGKDAELKKLAQKIKDEQDKEINELQKIQKEYEKAATNYDPENSKEGLGKAMMDDMMAMMKMPASKTTSVDEEFAVIMIKHHEDGIQMGNSIVNHAKDEQFKAMTKNMIASQNKDIQVMQQWLDTHKEKQ